MKKTTTLLTAALVAALLATPAMATDYTDSISISLDGGDPVVQEATISVVEQEDGLYTIVLNQFSFSSMTVGDVTATDLVVTTADDGTVYFTETTTTATITNGSVIAALLGGVIDVTIKDGSQVYGDQLYMAITLDVEIEALGMDYDVEAVFGTLPANDEEAGITALPTTDGNRQVVGVYDLSGRALSGAAEGQLRVIRYGDGTSEKVK